MSTRQPTITLLISCPDQPGIVSAVSSFVFQYNGNILESDQYSANQDGSTFFMRISFAEESFQLSKSALLDNFKPIAEHFHMQWNVYYSHERKRVGILVSKFDH